MSNRSKDKDGNIFVNHADEMLERIQILEDKNNSLDKTIENLIKALNMEVI